MLLGNFRGSMPCVVSHINFGAAFLRTGVKMPSTEIAERIFEALSDSPISFYRLCRKTKLHPKTVKRYLAFIEDIQTKGKVEIEREGFRVKIRKNEHNHPLLNEKPVKV